MSGVRVPQGPPQCFRAVGTARRIRFSLGSAQKPWDTDEGDPLTFCRCCFITALPAPVSSTERRPQVCGTCEKHYGNREKTARDHSDSMARLRDSHAAAMERLDVRRSRAEADLEAANERVQQLVATIATEYQQRPLGDIQRLLEQQVVKDAERAQHGAQRQRDRVMGAIFRIDELHHEVGENCMCGERITACPDFAAISVIREDYYKWERRQIELMAAGSKHGLPLDHPQGRGIKPWEWKGLPSTRESR